MAVLSKRERAKISEDISMLVDEGMPRKRAIAVAFSKARARRKRARKSIRGLDQRFVK